MGETPATSITQRNEDSIERALSLEGPTRRESRPPTHPSDAATLSSTSGSTQPTADALLAEEMGRVQVTARVLMVVVGCATLLIPFLGGDESARQWMIFGQVVAFGVLVQVHRLAASSAGYDVHQVGALCLVLATTLATAVNYFGIFSPAPMMGSLGLYIFCLGSSTRWSLAMFGVLGGGHLLLSLSVLGGLREDPGLIRAQELDLLGRCLVTLCVLCLYSIAYAAGRAARTKLVGAIEHLETAVRQVTEREVQLNEARRELQRAAWVGGEGRFTHQQIGSFRLGNIIGRGAMGEVYEAEHVTTGEEAAVKLLQRVAFGDPHVVARFAREANTASSLDSPHVARVIEVPAAGAPVPYMAMERLRGEDLGSLLRRERRLSRADTMRLVQQVGAALDAARRGGVVHRDLKPQNLFLARSEAGAPVWKVLDFGVSKVVGQHSLTRDQLVGTPEYMAPEQARGDAIDHRADLYALAAVAYRCLTGRPPFAGHDLATTVYRVVHNKPPAPTALARLGEQVEAVLAMGLARDPQDRFDSGKELARALEDALGGELDAHSMVRAKQLLEREPWDHKP